MALNCKIQPDNSKLFGEIYNYFKGNGYTAEEAREITKTLWGTVTTEKFQEDFGIEDFYNNNEIEYKEPTLDTIIEKLNLSEIVSSENDINKANTELGNTFKSNKVFDSYKDAAHAAIDINSKMPKVNAKVVQNSNGYSVEVSNRNPKNAEEPYELVFQSELCNKLLSIVNAAGFDIRLEDLVTNGSMFDPSKAEVTARNLINAISVAKGEKGEEEFPEEFSHMVIAGTRNLPVTIRLVNALKSDKELVKNILGNSYEGYIADYANQVSKDKLEDLLAEEAAGKLLTDKIIEKNSSRFDFLIDRLWTAIKRFFSRINGKDVRNAIIEAENAAYNLAKIADTKEIIPYLSDTSILTSPTLKHLETNITKAKKVSEKIMEIYAKKLQLKKAQSLDNKYTKTDMEFFRNMENNMKKQDHYNLYLNMMSDTIHEFRELKSELRDEYEIRKHFDLDDRKEIHKLARTARILRKFIEFNDVYLPVLESMASMKTLYEFGELEELTKEQAEDVSRQAREILDFMSDMSNSVISDLQFNVVLDFLRTFAGNELLKRAATGGDKEAKDLIESLLKRGTDINFIDKTVNSLASSSDLILQLIDKAVKTVHIRRDLQLSEFKNLFTAYTSEFIKNGGDPKFLLERIDGKKTGRIISDIDWEKFEKDKQAEIERIEKEYSDKSSAFKMQRLEQWIHNNTREYPVEEYDIEGNRIHTDSSRTERLPRQQKDDGTGPLYYTKPEEKRINRILNENERKYYYRYMFLKRRLDAAMPASEVSVYLAPQRLNSLLDGVMASDNKVQKFGKAISDRYKVRKDLGERGYFPSKDAEDGVFDSEDSIKKYEKQVNTGIDGKPLRKIPVYLTHKLDDMDRLSEDMAGGLIAYAGMVYNYIGMNEIVDLLEITKDWVINKREYEASSGVKMIDKFKTLGKEVEIKPTIKGAESNAAKRIEKYFEMVVYGKMKADQEYIIGGVKIDAAQWLDILKAYTGALGLGLNVFAGISNELMGKVQMFIESRGKEYFNTKDFAKAALVYNKEIWAYLGELNAVQKKSKMSLMIDKFDMLYEFFNEAKYDEYYKSDLARIIGKGNLYILNNLGEHVLHVQGSIAMLNHIKARIPIKDKEGNITGHKETNLYDAFEVKETKDLKNGTPIYSVELPEGTEILDEKTNEYKQFTKNDLINIRMKINTVNNKMHGAFNDEDRGSLQQNAIGRLIMQFRQWMPEYYDKRYSGKNFSAILDTETEGFYRTAGRFIIDTFKDFKRSEFQWRLRYKNLQEWEKANIRRFNTEMLIFFGLLALISMLGNLKDKKGYWAKRMLAYQVQRLRTEIGAGFSPKNAIQILQSPAAAINSFGGVLNIFKFWNMFNMIEAGRYEGWSKWHRDVYKAFPIIQQAQRLYDISTEDYMFLMFAQ